MAAKKTRKLAKKTRQKATTGRAKQARPKAASAGRNSRAARAVPTSSARSSNKTQKRPPASRPEAKRGPDTKKAGSPAAAAGKNGGPQSGKPNKAAKGNPGNGAKALRAKDGHPHGTRLEAGTAKRRDGGREGRETTRLLPAREPARVVPLPLLTPVKRPSIEERSASIDHRLEAASDDFKSRYIESFDMSWIYHDCALEGVVYTFEELRLALSGQGAPVADSGLQPTYDDIRRHKEAIDFVRDFGLKKRLPVTLDIIKKIYLILHPEEGDIKTVKYRKDIPQHRLYFHEYAPPDKIAYKVRQIVDWLNDPETRKTRNGIRIAARAHYDLLRVYPFPVDSGRVARLFMNLLLMRSGLPPSIIHSTERQRYYEALKGSATTVLQMVQESVENALTSVEKLLDEHESRKRAFVS
jgi:hypothetical protein